MGGGDVSEIIHRSVGAGNTQPLATGANNPMTVSGTTVTFTSPLPDLVGVGDAIVYDVDGNGGIDGRDTIAFIHARVSSTEYELRAASGGWPVPVADEADWLIHRAYVALADAVVGSENPGLPEPLRDFDSWSAGHDLVAADQSWHIACYADAPDTTPVLISGWTTSTTRRLRIHTPTEPDQVGARQRHTGVAGTGYVIDLASAAVPTSHAVEIGSDHVILEGLEITGWENEPMNNSYEGARVAADGVLLDGLIIHDDVHPDTVNPNADGINLNAMQDGWTVTVRNSLVYNISRGGILYQGSGAPVVVVENTTVVNTGTSGVNADGQAGIHLAESTGPATIRNTISVVTDIDSADFFRMNGNWGVSSNNLSSDTSAPGTLSLTGVTAAELFVSATAGAEDFHLLESAPGVDAGVDLPGFSVDFEGDPRPAGSWDVGADEVP
jgi:hypothetical protein